MQKSLTLGAAGAGLAVAFGAFGAHGLKTLLSAEMLAVWQTAVTYQMWHSLALVLLALLAAPLPANPLLIWAGRLLVAGIAIFSGSLYALALSNLKWLGMLTPVGGVCFLAAWLLIILFSLQKHP